MSELAIAFDGDVRKFEPGAIIAGRALWLLEVEPTAIEIRLFWRTEGKGDRDLEVVAVTRFDTTETSGEWPFTIATPPRPWSFSGKLVSLVWALEIVALPREESQSFDVTLAPGGREVVLFRGKR